MYFNTEIAIRNRSRSKHLIHRNKKGEKKHITLERGEDENALIAVDRVLDFGRSWPYVAGDEELGRL